jgi:peptidoglycan/LPS O-acetylase OafA/YrhL
MPILAWVGLTKRKKSLLTLLIISYLLLCLQTFGYIFPFNQNLNGGIIGNPYYYPRFFTYFLFGSCVYIFRNQIPRNTWVAAAFLLFFVLAFKIKMMDVIWPLAGTYLLFYTAYHHKYLFPQFAKYGDFSYGIYLYGWPIQQLVMLFLGKHLNVYTFIAVVYPIALLFAVLSWKMVECPALELKKHELIKGIV